MISLTVDTAPAPRPPRRRRFIGWFFLAVLLVPAALLLIVTLLAATPSGAKLAGRELSRFLGQPVTINALQFRGASLRVQGLAIGNTPPFTGNFLTVGSITMVPSLRLVTGTPSLALLEVKGATLALKQDPAGRWNVTPLLQRLRSRRGGGETFSGNLRIRETSLNVNDRVFPVMDISLRDLATRGSRDASWQVSFADRKRRPVTITGTVRPGASPAMTLAVDAPEIALSSLAQVMTLPPALDPGSGTAALHLTASLRGEVLEASGTLSFAGVSARLKERAIPLTGSLDLAGVYRTDRDEARISRGSVTLDGLAALSGTALIRKVKNDREFSADLAAGALDIGALRHLLYPEGMKGLTAAGRVTIRNLSLAGNARLGLTACRATVMLDKGEASWQGRALVREMAATLSVDKRTAGWALAGQITSGGGDPVELQSLTGVITARLSPRFRPLQVEVAPLSGVVRGIGIAGSIRYAASATEPLTLNLMTGKAPLTALSPYLKDRGRIAGGTATVTLAAAASQGLEEIHGAATATLDDLAATSATGKTVTGSRMVLDGRFRGGRNRPLEVTGRFTGTGTLDSRPAEADVAFSLTPERFQLELGRVLLDGARLTFARLHGQVPLRPVASVPEIPVRVQIQRLSLAWQDFSLEELSGTLDGAWRTMPEGGRFEGSGGLTAGRLSWRSWKATDLAARFAGDGTGLGGDLTGAGLGGRFAATFKAASFSPATPVSFRGSGRNLVAAQVMTAIGKPLPVTLAGGLLDADFTGSLTRTGGPRLAFTTAGNNLTVARNGTAILTNMGLSAEGEYGAGRFHLQRGKVNVGAMVAVTLAGEINDLPAATRTGTFKVSLPETPLAAAVNSCAGLLPASLHEVRTQGMVSLSGEIALGGGKTTLGGELHVTGGEVALPSQQFSMEGIEGAVPFSLILPAAGIQPLPRGAGFSREAYPRNLALLRQPLGAPTFRMARIRFGPLETGEARFQLKASGSRTELVRFETVVSGGELRGRGGFAWDRGPVYDFDLLANDLSLRRFCETIPAITGYLSGKVDGVIGLHGEQGGLNGILGYFDIWTRNSKDEQMLVSREFLQKLAGKKLKGFIFRDDRAYDRGELSGHLERGDITFSVLDIAHTNIFGVRDLSVTVIPTQNRISLEHLISSIRTAAQRGKPAKEEEGAAPAESLPRTEFKWLE